jgi:hypothetical protein
MADPPSDIQSAAPPRRLRLAAHGRLPAALAVSALTLGVAACGQGPGAGDQTTAIPSSAVSSDDSSLTTFDMLPIGGRFRDADHGAIVRTLCTDDGCSYQLVSTADGGASWKTEAIPGQPVVNSPLDDAYATVLGNGEVVTEIQVADGRPARHTSDGGTSWPAQSAQPLGAATRVPENGALVSYCAQSVNCPEPVLRVINADGSSNTFGPAPGNIVETISAARAPGGNIWVQGRDGVGRGMLAISKNDGASWTMNRVPVPASASIQLAGSDDDIWALSLTDPQNSGGNTGAGDAAPIEPGRKLRQTLFYSSDGGDSFKEVKVPANFQLNTGSGVSATSSGDAVLASDGKVVIIAPDGTTKQITSVHGAVYNLGAEVLVYGSDGSWISDDGEKWKELPAGS